jgi:hypothetical protein
MMDDSEYVSGNEIARQWREMPHRKQADKIVLEMIDNNVSIEQVLDFTGFTDHEFARMLAGGAIHPATVRRPLRPDSCPLNPS